MQGPSRRLGWQLFALSFAALFLELTVIRWIPSVVRLVAYYANLMLLSSFLGLGLGAMAGRRRPGWLGWFPALLLLEVGFLFFCRRVVFHGSAEEARFYALGGRPLGNVVLVALFLTNVLLFVPLGQRIGRLLAALPRLTGYAWDLGGSLCGVVCFGLFSLWRFSPLLGVAAVVVVCLALMPRRGWLWGVPLCALALAGMRFLEEPGTLWSPYHHVVVTAAPDPDLQAPPPPAELRTMRDPPAYTVNVNLFGFQTLFSQDRDRYTPGLPRSEYFAALARQYDLPYALHPGARRVVVLGAGGGADVVAALRAGASQVDAVEIDPLLVALSRSHHPDAPYADPRVRVHVDDARAFVARAAPGYDKVVYGFLDSQVLASSMDNIRLDGFVYTVEGIRAAYALLADGGMLSLSFYVEKDWLAGKLYRMVAEATGQAPIVYGAGREMIICVPRRADLTPPPTLNGFTRVDAEAPPEGVPATDDWPYLYLSRRTVPSDYLVVMGVLLFLAVLGVSALQRGLPGREEAHFALLGAGFMLLETKSITDCSLYFGSTWLVTLVVVCGVLLMLLAANAAAGRLRAFSPWLYLPLFAALALLLAVPRGEILALGRLGRLLWALGAVPLPLVFAGLIFSTRFREAGNPSLAFGSNLVGAMAGGFAEYLGMAVGGRALWLLVLGAYCGSALCLRRPPGGGTAQ